MPTLPSTQTQTANGVPLYVPTDGDGNATVDGNLVVDGTVATVGTVSSGGDFKVGGRPLGTLRGLTWDSATAVPAADMVFDGNQVYVRNGGTTAITVAPTTGMVTVPNLTVSAQPDGTGRGIAFADVTPGTSASVSYDGVSLSLARNAVTGLRVDTGGGAVAPVSMSAPRFINSSATQSVSFSQQLPAFVYLAGQVLEVASLNISALSNFKMIGVVLDLATPAAGVGNWSEVSGSGGLGGNGVTVSYAVTPGNNLLSMFAPIPTAGAIYGNVVNGYASYATIAYPGDGLLKVFYQPNFPTSTQTLTGHLSLTVFGII